MRALTLIQPMGSAIVMAHPKAKRHENRPQDLPESMRGVETVVAVHAGKKWDNEYADTIHDITGIQMWRGQEPEGAVIGVMTLTGRVYAANYDDWYMNDGRTVQRVGEKPSEWCFGRFAYEIKDATAIATPVPCKGALGFWTLAPDLERQVVEQLGEQPRMFPKCVGTTHLAPTNSQCKACGLYGQRCELTERAA